MEEFDTLRREATKLERNLEDKISRYHLLAQKIQVDSPLTHRSVSQTSSSLEAAESGSVTNSVNEENLLANEINRTLGQMNDLINTKMAPAAERSMKAQHSLLVKRYREILFDSTNDFKKASGAIHRKRESMELFSGAGSNGMQVEDPAMEQLLRERNAIGNSIKSATSVLNQASDIRNELRNQGMALKGVGTKVLNMAGKIPGLNGLIDNIRRRRGRDDMVVSGTIAVCVLFTLWYVLG
jgi:Golgi SNAP receptor complex protein 1|eukprot:scaffold3357_cov268-Chaetoceros_neogracile.AAC.20